MTEAENKVMLQVEVRESTRTRLKLQAVRLGVTMGELADQLLNEALNKLEQEQREGNKRTEWLRARSHPSEWPILLKKLVAGLQ